MGNQREIGPDEVRAAVEKIAGEIAERHRDTPNLLLLGIAKGGIPLARRLSAMVSERLDARKLPQGTIDISFHRDDIAQNPIPKEYPPTQLPGDTNGATVILVDDVLFSGRTAKAALDELFDHGRPEKVELAVLVDRGHRMLPIAADYCGLVLETSRSEKVKVQIAPESGGPASILIQNGASPA